MLLSFSMLVLAAAPGGPLTLDEVLKDVASRAPTVRVREEDVDIARARVGVEGAWQDPQVSVMVEDVPFSSGEAAPMPMVTWRFAQELNVFGRRTLLKNAARAQRDSELALVRRTSWDAQAQAVAAFYDIWMIREMRALIDRQIAILERMRASARARYVAGLMMGHHDILRSDAEIATMRAERAALESQERAMEAMLNVLRGAPVDTEISELLLPDRDPVPPREAPLALAAQRPEVEAMRQMVVEMEARRGFAGRMYLPMPMVGLFYQQRPGMEPDSFGGELLVNVPLWWFDRQRNEVAMADAMVRRARRGLEAMELMTQTDLRAAWSRARASDLALIALETTAIPRMKETVASAEAEYVAGTGDYLRLLEAVMAQQELEANRLELVVQRAVAMFELARVLGAELSPDEKEPKP